MLKAEDFNIDGPRDISLIERINNVAIILKYLAIHKDNSICLFSDDDASFTTKLIMDRDLNLLSPMKYSEIIDGIWKDIGCTYICMNNISWSVLLRLADEISQSDKWKEIKLIVAGSKVINSEIRRGVHYDRSDK